jgi:hypothetical protein
MRDPLHEPTITEVNMNDLATNRITTLGSPLTAEVQIPGMTAKFPSSCKYFVLWITMAQPFVN